MPWPARRTSVGTRDDEQYGGCLQLVARPAKRPAGGGGGDVTPGRARQRSRPRSGVAGRLNAVQGHTGDPHTRPSGRPGRAPATARRALPPTWVPCPPTPRRASPPTLPQRTCFDGAEAHHEGRRAGTDARRHDSASESSGLLIGRALAVTCRCRGVRVATMMRSADTWVCRTRPPHCCVLVLAGASVG